MAYRKTYRRRRAPARRRRATRSKRTATRTSRRYRKPFARSLQLPNMNPTTLTMKFVQKEIYYVANPGQNSNSTLQIPMADMQRPTVVSGTWTPEGNWLWPGFNAVLPLYRHYVVRGSKLQVRCVPATQGVTDHKNKMYTQLNSNSNAVSSTATTEEMFESFNSSERNWYNAGVEVGARDLRNYSPAKVWHIPKSGVMGNANLKCPVGTNNLPGSAADRTFTTVSLKRMLTGPVTEGHDAAIVTILATYLVTFMEHIGGAGAGVQPNFAYGGAGAQRRRLR